MARYRVKARQGQFFYRQAGPAGAAPAMVHIHGFGISGSYLLPTAGLLTNEFDTYVPDLPGFGRSPGPPKPMSIIELGDSVISFLDSVGLETATLVGNSMGCPVIARAMQRHPDRVDRAILVSPAGGLHNRPIGRGLAQLAVDGLREPPSLIKVAGPDYARFGLVNGLRLFNEMTKSPTIKILQELNTPMLLVLGSRDPLQPERQRIDDLASAVGGNAGIVWLHGPAHAINFSHPEQLSQVIRTYMNDPTLPRSDALPGNAEILVRAQR
ncbi:MAG: alpha/beta fold hydrolase [Candidatus Nanopelagicales bacterium]